MTLADAIGVLRALATIPVAAAIVLQAPVVALGVFGAAAATDALDGWIARRTGTTTAHGAFLDPLADKILVVGTLVALALAGSVDPILAAAIAGREALVLGLRSQRFAQGRATSTVAAAKTKTVCEMLGLVLLMTMDARVSALANDLLVVALAVGILTIPHYLPRRIRRLT